MTDQEQFQCLNLLEYLADLFTIAGRDQFNREDVLSILNRVRDDPEMFDPDVVIAQQIATSDIG